MPWKACSVMDGRLRFIARLLEGESMSDLWRDQRTPRSSYFPADDGPWEAATLHPRVFRN
jgi:hypothetical protein